ncbi:hypothetical protein [Maribacter hydrothermalis]|uniref:Uncharacterized protein n=1 Tax=Maribacter hydrothermalis TaxID=1836467 RepID=A0A1B7ZET7_9FLAO|nr:hypothetical protein [Maribacter hydrothermalis]APQ17595.1 hypothetical protein BTR34_09750 [Maribacter hydrothermalis]OBR42070.1 hypothetical protein A9200_01380 [Maribacter hydrothermalis]
MKNYKKTILLGLVTLAVFTFNSTKAADNPEALKSTITLENLEYINTVFERLVSKINEGFIFNAHISSSTVKKDGNVELPFTTFGSGPLKLTKGDILKIENVETAFNDRNNFQSKKTVESISISSSGNNVKVKMQFHTWSQNVELSNVKITKEQFGYFITGSQSNNTKTVYYTITISHRGKII